MYTSIYVYSKIREGEREEEERRKKKEKGETRTVMQLQVAK